MFPSRELGGATVSTRKFRIGSTVVEGQVVIWDGINGPGIVCDPASVNSYVDAVGITMEAGTYAATSPGQFVKCSYSPLQVVRSKASGGTANDTAHTTAVILTQAGVANLTTVVADANVADLDYSCGYLVGLTGANAGSVRLLTGQSDSTSCTVTVPFGAASAAGDTFLRTYSEAIRGVELTAEFQQVNNLLASGEALYTSSIGEFITVEVFVDSSSISQSAWVPITNPSNPLVEFDLMFQDHVWNQLS